MKNARLQIACFALALCALGSPSQAQNDALSEGLNLAAATPVQRTRGTETRSRGVQSSRPVSRPKTTQRPTSRPAPKPVQRPAARPAPKPVQRPAARPTSRPAQRPTAQPVQRPTSRPAARPVQRPTSRPAVQPVQRPTTTPSRRPSTTPERAQPTSRPTTQPTRALDRGRNTPARTTDPRTRNTNPVLNDQTQTPTYRPKQTRPIVPRASDATALQRARERARSTTRPQTATPNQPTTAQRIQRDRIQRARSASKVQPSTASGKTSTGILSKSRPSTAQDPARLSAGATRIQAARDRIRKTNEASGKTRVAPAKGIQDRSKDQRVRAPESKRSDAKRPGTVDGRLNDSRATGRVKDASTLRSRESKRIKTARKDYVDSKARGSISGGSLVGRSDLDRTGTRSGGAISAGSGRGGSSISAGSGHGRSLWRHNNHDRYRHRPYSNAHWNWNIWGSGYGWFWCPAQWATTCWWDAYWYSGGYWNYGYRPSFYYCGPFAPSTYTVIVQVNDDPIVVQEAPSQPPAQVAEAVAPAPQVEPAINRAAEYYLTLGDRAFRSGRYADAVHHYGKAVEYSPGEGILYLILSDALFATGDYHYGAFTLRKALELDPSLVDLTVDKRSFYDRPADLDAQMTRARTFNLQNPSDNDARLMLIANELFIGNPDAALRLLDQPESRATLETNAGILLQERALLDVERAQQVDGAQPSDPIFEVIPLEQD